MRKLVLLLCCISVLSLLGGCKAEKEETDYLHVDEAEDSLDGIPGTDYNTETEYIYDDSSDDSCEEYSETEYAAVEYPALIDNEWDMLPEYVYPGDDPIEKAITEYFISNNYHYEMKSSVVIPAFCIFMSEVDENDTDVGKVYGNYWLFGYEKNDTTLECVSGGENPGVIYLKKDGNSYVVDHFDKPGEGAKYVEDIISLCNGNQTLAEHYYNSSNALAEPVKSKKDWTIKKYVEMYDLDIDSYHDYGCDKVMLSDYHSDEGIEE